MNSPATQAVHPDEPAKAAKYPAAQATQTWRAVVEAVPAIQLEQEVELDVLA